MDTAEFKAALGAVYAKDVRFRINRVLEGETLETLQEVLAMAECREPAHIVRTLADPTSSIRIKVDNLLIGSQKRLFAGYGMFRGFHDVLLPKLVTQFSTRRTLLAWTPHCNTGEETYSVAIALVDGLKHSRRQCSVVGTDFDQDNLRTAETARYDYSTIDSEPLGKYSPYLRINNGDTIFIDSAVKSHVTFSLETIFQHEPEEPYQLIFFRDMLPQCSVDYQKKVITRLYDLLCLHGVLVLGVRDSLMGLSKNFSPIEGARGFYQRIL